MSQTTPTPPGGPESDDRLLFVDEDGSRGGAAADDEPAWKIVIIDDEAEVHNVTRLVLAGFTYRGRGLKFLSAYSGAQARRLLLENQDAAVVLLDVVMEENDTGLTLVKFIRDTLANHFMRIILRTGQPGFAPEEKVIVEYDINDYKEKTELTAQKLTTAIVAALRTYCDIQAIEAGRGGLERIIQASKEVFERKSMHRFALSVLSQFPALLRGEPGPVREISSLAALAQDGIDPVILAATGRFAPSLDQDMAKSVPPETVRFLKGLEDSGKTLVFGQDRLAALAQSHPGMRDYFYFEGFGKLDDLDKRLLGIFFANVAIAFDNLCLNREIEDTQREIIFTLGETIECRSEETGHHVRRVSEYIRLLALKYGLPEEEADLLRLATPLHDVGKLAVPDAVLNKPGRLTEAEFSAVKRHSGVGFDLLKPSRRAILQAAAVIANQHHERYDGTGYPAGLKGEDIHIYGRLAAVVDVFDALASDRVYRKAWDLKRIVDHLLEQRGSHFDPKAATLLVENLDEFLAIRDQFSDAPRAEEA